MKCVLRQFQTFAQALGTQTVTITFSSLLHDMLESYDDLTQTQGAFFHCHEDAEAAAREFLFTRECFFFHENRLPVVQATFMTTASDLRDDELNLQIHYGWNPPTLDFQHLRNVAQEGGTFMLPPSTVSSPPLSCLQPHVTEYFVGPAEEWLQWDKEDQSFVGTVPPELASRAGAERLDQFTTSIELTAIMTKHFAGGVKFERIFRVAIPLTVQRRPDVCSRIPQMMASPPPQQLAHDLPAAMRKEHRFRKLGISESRSGSPAVVSRPTFAKSPLRPQPSPNAAPSTTVLRRTRPGHKDTTPRDDHNENENLSLRDLDRLLKQKAHLGSPPSSLNLDALSLSRYHDAGGFHPPPPSFTDMEVRTVFCDGDTPEPAGFSFPFPASSSKSAPPLDRHDYIGSAQEVSRGRGGVVPRTDARASRRNVLQEVTGNAGSVERTWHDLGSYDDSPMDPFYTRLGTRHLEDAYQSHAARKLPRRPASGQHDAKLSEPDEVSYPRPRTSSQPNEESTEEALRALLTLPRAREICRQVLSEVAGASPSPQKKRKRKPCPGLQRVDSGVNLHGSPSGRSTLPLGYDRSGTEQKIDVDQWQEEIKENWETFRLMKESSQLGFGRSGMGGARTDGEDGVGSVSSKLE